MPTFPLSFLTPDTHFLKIARIVPFEFLNFGIFHQFFTQNVNVARFARNVEFLEKNQGLEQCAE